MFRPNKPSSGQFTNHTEGIISTCAHCGIPNVHKSYDNKSYKCLSGSHYYKNQSICHNNSIYTFYFHTICKHLDPTMCTCAHLLNVPAIWFVNWPDDGSMSRNTLPDL